MLDLLSSRRSIRKYLKKEVPERCIASLTKAALYSPSGRNLRPWEITIVTDPELIRKLSEAKPTGADFLADAALAFVIAGLPEKSDIWIEDTAIVSTNILLEAEALGLGACWIHIRNRSAADGSPSEKIIKDLLQIPGDRSITNMIAIGYPDEEKPGYTEKDLHWEKVFRNIR
ncbi:MAG: nitroreductase family protein [Spirochaetales bacterium]|nr:nitroreductase family protein [Spirochaetales bacterium]